MKKYGFLLLLILCTLAFTNTWACTTFIISGSHTADGKPILFKHRDSRSFDNSLVYFSDGKYDHIAVVNAERDNWNTMAWGGYNSAGFAIMNSAAYNNNMGDTTQLIDQEGIVMKLALERCKTIADFERLLQELPKPMGVDANFGVIDAFGGAAYYETGNYKYTKVDVNDPLVAPNGYLIRTNHSFSGDMTEGGGFIRYATTQAVLDNAAATGQLEPQYLLNQISRNLKHSLTKTNLYNNMPERRNLADYKDFTDYIPRYTTTSTLLVVGLKKNENLNNMMMWTILGFPLTTVAVPTWLTKDKQLPKLVSMQGNLHAPLCDAALKLKKHCFPIARGSGSKYINRSIILNKENTGYLQLLAPIEQKIFDTTKALIEDLPAAKDRDAKIGAHYHMLDAYVNRAYQDLFKIQVLD